MARSGLSGRLGRIRQAQRITHELTASRECPEGEHGGQGNTPLKTEDESGPELPGWLAYPPYVHERSVRVPIQAYRSRLSAHLPLLFPRERAALIPLVSDPQTVRSLVFFDLETTGLSHGAGTVAFMAGVARFTSDGEGSRHTENLEITQLLLDDYPGEAAFLTRFAELTGDCPIFVSFNGKSFDSQILYNRFLLNGIRPAYQNGFPIHLDLLYPSRRIWKGELGSCSLSALEAGVLGTPRVDDLPGSEAPDAWFDFVRSGKTERLLAIGEHNRDDCASLAQLLFALDDAIESGSGMAALIRACALRAERRYDLARAFLEPLAERGDRVALRLLAVDTEHRIGDLDRSLECARALDDARRVERLERKIGVRDASAGQSFLTE